MFAEDAHHGNALALVIVAGARAVCVDVVDVGRLKAAALQCLHHGPVGTFTVRRGGCLMECVASVAVAGKLTDGRRISLFGDGFRLHD